MPSINEWKGNAVSRSESWKITVLSAVPDSVYVVDAGRGIEANYQAVDGDTVETIADALGDLLGAFDDLIVTVNGAVITISGPEGEPIGAGVGPVSSPVPASYVERIQAGQLAIGKIVDVTFPEDATGGTYDITFDFGGGNETASGVAFPGTVSGLKSAIEGLTTPVAGDVGVSLMATAPRTYRIEFLQNLLGIDVDVSVDGTDLTGAASANIQRLQSPGDNVREVQTIWVPKVDIASGVSISFRSGPTASWSAWTTRDYSAATTDSAVATEVEALLNTTLGSGVASVDFHYTTDSGAYGTEDLHSAITILFTDAEPHDLVEARIRYDVAPTITYAATTEKIRTGGGSSNNEIQLVKVTTPGGHTLTYSGQTTSSITDSLTEAQRVTILEALSNIGSGDVVVWASPLTGPKMIYLVEFDTALGNTNVSQMTASGASISTIANGGSLENEVWSIWIDADGGTFTLTDPDGPTTTSALAYNIGPSSFQTALVGVYGSGNISLSGTGTEANPFVVEHVGANAATAMTLATLNGSSLTGGPDPSVSVYRAAVEGQNEIQRLVIDPNANGGTYSLGFGGLYSASLDYDSTASEIDTTLGAVSTIGSASNIATDGEFNSYLIEFVSALAKAPQDLIEIDQSELTVSASAAMSIEVVQASSGPNHWNVAHNWTRNRVPDTGDLAILGSGNTDILHGLRQRADFSTEASSTLLTLAGAADFVDDQIVRVKTTDTLPALSSGSLSTSTNYYIVSVGVDDDGNTTLEIATTSGGAPIEFAGAGTGIHTIEVQLAGIRQFNRFSGELGWPRRDNDGNWEERPRFLMIGLESATESNCELGIGPGGGSNRLNFDFGAAPLKARILESGSGSDVPAIQLLTDSLSTGEVDVLGGEVGFAVEADEAAELKWLRTYGGRVVAGNLLVGHVRDYGNNVEFAGCEHTADGIQFTTASN